MIVDERTDRLFGELEHVSTIEAVDVASTFAAYLDLDVVAFLNDEPDDITVLVTTEGDVLRRGDPCSEPVWEFAGTIGNWRVEPKFRPREVPAYLSQRTLPRPKAAELLLPPLDLDADAAMAAPDGHVDFRECCEAISYAESLCAVIAEHGLDAAVIVSAELGYGPDHLLARCQREERLLRPTPVQSCAGGG